MVLLPQIRKDLQKVIFYEILVVIRKNSRLRNGLLESNLLFSFDVALTQVLLEGGPVEGRVQKGKVKGRQPLLKASDFDVLLDLQDDQIFDELGSGTVKCLKNGFLCHLRAAEHFRGLERVRVRLDDQVLVEGGNGLQVFVFDFLCVGRLKKNERNNHEV